MTSHILSREVASKQLLGDQIGKNHGYRNHKTNNPWMLEKQFSFQILKATPLTWSQTLKGLFEQDRVYFVPCPKEHHSKIAPN